jgi:SAM-dependent methyltransferase
MMQSISLITAGELGVFVALGDGPLTTEELASRIGASIHGTEALATLLVQTGYLERTAQDQFRNSAHAQAWFSKQGARDLNSGLNWFAHSWRILQGLPEAVRQGRPKTVLWDQMQTSPGMGTAFAAYMKDYASTVVDDVQRAVTLPPGAKTLLDVGGSHGLHAAAFCRRSPDLRAVIYDLPVSLMETRDLIATWGLRERMECIEGDIRHDPIPGTFDVITYFLVAHNHSAADNARIVQKMAGALNPGGTLFIYEYPRDLAARFTRSYSEALAAAFDLTLLVETGTRTHPADEIESWLHQAGLSDVQRTELEPIEKGVLFRAGALRGLRGES